MTSASAYRFLTTKKAQYARYGGTAPGKQFKKQRRSCRLGDSAKNLLKTTVNTVYSILCEKSILYMDYGLAKTEFQIKEIGMINSSIIIYEIREFSCVLLKRNFPIP